MTKRLTRISDVVRDLCDEAKYTSKITLMQSLVQQISQAKRRDVVVEADLEGDEPVAGLLYVTALAAVSGASPAASQPQRILLVPEEMLPVIQAFLSGLGGRLPVVLGLSDDARDDLHLLRQHTPAMVATPRRLIDHARRKNISFDKAKCICIIQPRRADEPQESDGYSSDIQFVFTKLARHVQSVLFCQPQERDSEIDELLNRPKIVTPQVRQEQQEIVYCQYNQLNAQHISDYIYAQQLHHVHILCTRKPLYHAMMEFIEKNNPLYRASVSLNGEGGQPVSQADHLIIAGLPETHAFAELQAYISQADEYGPPHIVMAEEEETKREIFQENYRMKKQSLPKDQDVLKGKIAALIDEVERDSKPEELNELRKLIKKAAPFYRRGYLTAYLLREYLQEDGQSTPRSQRKEVDPDLAATLFFGVGKNRKTFPKDIARLLKEEAGLDNEEIYSIKTLDNYSFVSVAKDKAPTAIEKLDGMKYKGRPLVVNFAKSKSR